MLQLQKPGREEQGNALVLSVLIILALTSVGVVSIQRTNTDLLVAGNVVRAMQAQIAGEAITTRATMIIGQVPNQAADLIHKQSLMARGGFVENPGSDMDASERVGGDLFTSSTNAPDPYAGIAMVQSDVPMARIRQAIAQDVEFAFVGEGKGWPGYDVDADICHLTFDFTGRGGIPAGDEPVGETLCPRYREPGDPPCSSKSVIVETRSRVVAGPVKCSGTTGGG